MRALAGLLLTLSTAACDGSGEVMVVLDTTMRGDGVEVVAFRSDDAANDASSRGVNTAPRARTPLDDSAATLAEQFRVMRDSLNAEVARLDSVDRRSRAYAVRYAEIRRRTIAAEQLRARRDSVQARASRGAASASGSRGAAVALPSLTDVAGLQRHAIADSSVVLELPPGRWSIGAARDGRLMSEPMTLTVHSGQVDTLRIPTVARPAASGPK